MFNITILSIGAVKTDYFKAAIAEYLKRLGPYAKVAMVELPAESFTESQKVAAKKKEGKRIEEYLSRRPEARVFLLDERGVELDSIELSKKLDKINEPIIFVIGGSLGLEPELLARHEKISLSKLTFLHEMTKVVLLEQIYRSIAIIKGKNYHY
ncbi:MAG: 23S rRNA (pseudouridine(1915)-N(3))-methyltransferase RlmH [Candidatus Falkowbacteria bacterium]